MDTNTPSFFSPSVNDFMAQRHEKNLYSALQFAANAAEWIEQDETGQMLALFDTQYGNCASAMEYALQHLLPEQYDMTSDLFLALGRYHDIRSHHEENRRWGTALVRAANLPLPPDIAERTAWVVGEDDQLIVLEENALAALIPQALHDRAEMVNLRGYGLWQIGRRDDALAFYHEAIRLFQRAGEIFGEAGVMLNISSSYDLDGNSDQAVSWGRKALAVAEAAKHEILIAEISEHLVAVLEEGVYSEEVCQLFERSVTGFKQLNDIGRAANAQFDYALYRFSCGEIETSLVLAKEAITFYEQAGSEKIQLLRAWINHVEMLLGPNKEM